MVVDANDRGEISLLGIYGHSAYNAMPADVAVFDVNMVPMMFFDYLPTKKGEVMVGVMIDGQLLTDFADRGVDGAHIDVDPSMTEARQVKRRAVQFWVPQKFRTPGNHEVKLLTGYDEYYRDVFLRQKIRTVWTATKTCTLTLTGTKRDDD